jgi:hypothetical protein
MIARNELRPRAKGTSSIQIEKCSVPSTIERDYTGPVRVSGSAGTGKTIVALHRAAYLARTNPDARVLLTTFSDALAGHLQTRLNRLVSSEPRLAERIDVYSMGAIAQRLYKMHITPVSLADRAAVSELIREASLAVGGHKFSQHFLLTEWEQVVDAWQLEPGKHIAMWLDSVVRRDCPRHSAECFGRSLRRCGRCFQDGTSSPRRPCSPE